MKALKVLAIVLLATFSFTAVNAQMKHKMEMKHHPMKHKMMKRHHRMERHPMMKHKM